MKFEVKGTIIPNDYREVYEWFNMDCTSPNMLVITNEHEPIEVEINSQGGDVFSGSEIYTKLKNHKGKVTVNIIGVAASMASVIAMAGSEINISPTAQIMIHNVSSYGHGNKNDFKHESEVLEGYDKTIAKAYMAKTKLSEKEILEYMDKETWFTPDQALELKFVDNILFESVIEPQFVASKENILPKNVIENIKKILAKKGEKGMGEEIKKDIVKKLGTVEEEKTIDGETKKEIENMVEKKFNDFGNKMYSFKNEISENKLEKIEGDEKKEKENYRSAFFNTLQGKSLSAYESEILKKQNAFTHDTTNTSLLIPQSTQDKIWSRITEGYGFLEDITKYKVPGELRIVKHATITEGDANWYVEATTTSDEKNIFEEFVLKGHELSKAVIVSWKLKAMAIDEFEDFIAKEIAERMGVALATGVTQGTGINQPKGVVTELKKKTERVVKVGKTGTLTYQEVLNSIAKIHSAYKKDTKIYANANTIWSKLASVTDSAGRPIFIPKKTPDSLGLILGFEVKEDASLKDDEIIFGDAKGYVMNVNEEMTMIPENNVKQRTTEYVGYMVADGNVLDEKALSLLLLTQA